MRATYAGPSSSTAKYFMDKAGVSQKGSLAKQTGDTIHFYVTSSYAENFHRYCSEIVLPSDPVSVINQYTDHTNEKYAQINFALAADSPVLSEHGGYIADLRASILNQPFLEHTNLYRGVDLSDEEVEHMEKLNTFFIPSFTSTRYHGLSPILLTPSVSINRKHTTNQHYW